MSNRLDRIMDWEERAWKAVYRATVLTVSDGVTLQQLDRYSWLRWGVVPDFWIDRLRIYDCSC